MARMLLMTANINQRPYHCTTRSAAGGGLFMSFVWIYLLCSIYQLCSVVFKLNSWSLLKSKSISTLLFFCICVLLLIFCPNLFGFFLLFWLKVTKHFSRSEHTESKVVQILCHGRWTFNGHGCYAHAQDLHERRLEISNLLIGLGKEFLLCI